MILELAGWFTVVWLAGSQAGWFHGWLLEFLVIHFHRSIVHCTLHGLSTLLIVPYIVDKTHDSWMTVWTIVGWQFGLLVRCFAAWYLILVSSGWLVDCFLSMFSLFLRFLNLQLWLDNFSFNKDQHDSFFFYHLIIVVGYLHFVENAWLFLYYWLLALRCFSEPGILIF